MRSLSERISMLERRIGEVQLQAELKFPPQRPKPRNLDPQPATLEEIKEWDRLRRIGYSSRSGEIPIEWLRSR